MIVISNIDDLKSALSEAYDYLLQMDIGGIDNKLLEDICHYTGHIECMAHNCNTDAMAALKKRFCRGM
jgi:hypothetical protein